MLLNSCTDANPFLFFHTTPIKHHNCTAKPVSFLQTTFLQNTTIALPSLGGFVVCWWAGVAGGGWGRDSMASTGAVCACAGHLSAHNLLACCSHCIVTSQCQQLCSPLCIVLLMLQLTSSLRNSTSVWYSDKDWHAGVMSAQLHVLQPPMSTSGEVVCQQVC